MAAWHGPLGEAHSWPNHARLRYVTEIEAPMQIQLLNFRFENLKSALEAPMQIQLLNFRFENLKSALEAQCRFSF